ncbi:MAG: hypothetical protein ACKON9_00275, partial [Planctomycetaceae bacterium]
MLTGALLLAGLRSGLLTSPAAQGLAIGWLAWWMFGRSKKSQPLTDSRNAQPNASAAADRLDNTVMMPQQQQSEPTG